MRQAVHWLKKTRPKLSDDDARALAILLFGKGRPDFLELVELAKQGLGHLCLSSRRRCGYSHRRC